MKMLRKMQGSPRLGAILAVLLGALAAGVWLLGSGRSDDAVRPDAAQASAAGGAGIAVQAPPVLNAPPPAAVPASVTQPAAAPSSPATRAIGSEGYGPHVRAAFDSADAEAAWEAARWLEHCRNQPVLMDKGLEKLQALGLPAESVRRMVEQTQAELRRCQTVTPDLAALESELAWRAMRAGILGAASHVFKSRGGDRGDINGTGAGREELLQALRRDAANGDSDTLILWVTAGTGLGASAVERRGYRLAHEALNPLDKHFELLARDIPAMRAELNVVLSPEDEARALAVAQPIIAAGKARGGPRPWTPKGGVVVGP